MLWSPKGTVTDRAFSLTGARRSGLYLMVVVVPITQCRFFGLMAVCNCYHVFGYFFCASSYVFHKVTLGSP
ncbi:hypothetical protein BDV40DRAFT_258515 [Aspergillus tamarii]|uniref:Uncharacterized protein n=1 Tax=Aspergillus tamarii TaxID=41984 RepID=A0A5N6V322_ASPTM|nr:hypothetical protein BDV40DRAFT_258515 [Aspergillus tamarii]